MLKEGAKYMYMEQIEHVIEAYKDGKLSVQELYEKSIPLFIKQMQVDTAERKKLLDRIVELTAEKNQAVNVANLIAHFVTDTGLENDLHDFINLNYDSVIFS